MLSSTTNRVSYSGNGTSTVFSFPYYFLNKSDLVIVLRASDGTETTKVLTTDYTVTGDGVSSGGSVTMLSAPASGTTLSIYRDPTQTQTNDLTQNGSYPAETVEAEFDKLTMLAQRSKDRLDRAVTLSEGYAGSFNPKLPNVLTPDCVIQVSADGTKMSMGPTANAVAMAQTNALAAAASASAASVSQTAAASSATSAAGSATAASTSATNAASSATAAATSASAASTSASGASTSATNAANSATAAATSQSAASTSATNAAGSATAAATSASNASGSATAAATSATNAASSATAASTSASNAASSETNAAASATAAANTLASALWRDVVFLTSASSPKTIVQADNGKLFVCDTSGGAITINLPTISGVTTPFNIGVKLEAGLNSVTINRGGSDTIDGSSTKVIAATSAGCQIIADTDPAPDVWTAVDFGVATGNMTVDSFTGDGSTVAFTLTAAPSSKNNTWVSVGGVVQQKASYSVSGTTLTFTSAPPNAVSIECVSGTTVSIGVPGDGTVTNAKMSTMANNTIKGNVSGSTSAPSDLSSQNVKDILHTPPTIQKFTSGSGTYTTPANCKYIRVRMVGGGGGGAGSGTAGVGASGGAGGNTTFGTSLLVANGGGGATVAGAPGVGGTGSLGTGPIGSAIQGGGGGGYSDVASTSYYITGGMGGSSFFASGSGGTANAAAPAAPSNTGAGGGGGGGASGVGMRSGTGGGAGAYVEAIITNPSATYSYAVGAAGAAGTGTTAGAPGGSGYLEVTEFYQ
jgi:hypothetical protein